MNYQDILYEQRNGAVTITINWTENSAAALNSGTANSTATTNMSYTLVNQI